MKGEPTYLLAKDYAEMHGVKSVTIRAWIARGKLPGATKFRGDWMIPSTLIPPKDNRLTTGEYVGWRKKYQPRSENKQE